MFIVSYMGKPVGFAVSNIAVKRRIVDRIPGSQLLFWSDTDKLMRKLSDRNQFTGWEIAKVDRI
jgi:hypothetical protein